MLTWNTVCSKAEGLDAKIALSKDCVTIFQ